MKYPLELHILGERVDTFSDEGITVKQVVKSFRDPKKIFTDFSQDFNIPASKTNNKILKHPYRIDLPSTDTRAFIEAELKLNGVVFKEGNVSIESTKMKDGAPYSYKLRFFGKITDLTKKIGDDELTDLGLNEHDIVNPSFSTLFRTGSDTDTIKFPLISRSYRYIAHSTDHDFAETQELIKTKNIHYSSSSRAPNHYGLTDEDMTGAIRVKDVIEAIESKYGVTFLGVLKNDYVSDLHLVLQKQSKSSSGGSLPSTYLFNQLSPYIPYDNTDDAIQVTNQSLTIGEYGDGGYNLPGVGPVEFRTNIETTVSTAVSKFEVNIKKNGAIIDTYTANGSKTLSHHQVNTGDVFTWEVVTAGVGNISISCKAKHEAIYRRDDDVYNEYSFSDVITATSGGQGIYSVNENLPEMKVMDFISTLFKRFNIVVDIDSNLNINTMHFDYFMNQGSKYDLSKYIDVSSFTISKPNYYNSIEFLSEEPKTILEQGFLKVNARKYGELRYNPLSSGGRISGSSYKVDIGSQMIPLENLTDLDDGERSFLQYMQLSDADGTEQQCKPIFTYIATAGSFLYVAYDTGASVSAYNGFYMPFNRYTNYSVSDAEGVVGNYTGYEVDEYTLNSAFGALGFYNMFWDNTVALMFDEGVRRVEYTAKDMPLSVLTKINLNDIIKIHDKSHCIESVSTNYLTGETKLSLIMVQDEDLDRFNVNTTTVTATSVNNYYSYMNTDGEVVQGIFSTGDVITHISNKAFRTSF